jgi:hypothetical protein
MNKLDNGAVLPQGLLSTEAHDMMAGFNKSYKSYALRIGIVTATYPVSDESNRSKLTTEYDVLVVEQHEDKGATTIQYRNCMSAEGLGSIADFFEMALRPKKKKTTKGDSTNLKGQDGSIVLMLCLDGMSDKAIIIGHLTHPDRKTTLKDEGPYLQGEYNGINVVINTDGSATLTFRGATDAQGKPLDDQQGPTVITIEKDGSYQVKHKTITQRLDKNGKADLTADDDISNTTKKNFNVTTNESINFKATKDFNIDVAALAAKASGSATLECQKLSVQSQSEITLKGSQMMVEAESMAKIKSAQITLDGLVALGGDGGQPILLLSTMFLGIGNVGAPVLSTAIAGYAVKVTAT